MLRERPELGNVALVAVTGYGQEADRRQAATSGFNAHLVKPVGLDRLRDVMRALVAGESASS